MKKNLLPVIVLSLPLFGWGLFSLFAAKGTSVFILLITLCFISFVLGIVGSISQKKNYSSNERWLCIAGIFLSVITLFYIAINPLLVKLAYFGKTIDSIKFADSCRCNLEGLGMRIERYQLDNSGQYPSSLEQLTGPSSHYLLKCPADKTQDKSSYVYQGDGLSSSMSDNLILAYEKNDNHPFRHVLYSQPWTSYWVLGQEVDKAAFKEFFIVQLKGYNKKLVVEIKNPPGEKYLKWLTNEKILVVPKETCDPFLLEMIVKDLENNVIPPESVAVRKKTSREELTLCCANTQRVKVLNEKEFQNAIKSDNTIRKKYVSRQN